MLQCISIPNILFYTYLAYDIMYIYIYVYTGLARGSASLFGLLGASVFPYLKNKIGIYVYIQV